MYGIPGYSDTENTPDLSVKIDWKRSFQEAGMFIGMFALGYLAVIGGIEMVGRLLIHL